MKKGTKNLCQRVLFQSPLCLSFLIFFNANGTVAPAAAAAAAAAAAVPAAYRIDPRQPNTARQAGSHVRWVRRRGAPALRGVLPLLLGRVRRQEPTRGQSVAQSGRHCQSGRTAGRRRVPHESNEWQPFLSWVQSHSIWLLLCILCIGFCPSTCISYWYHSSSFGISLPPSHRHDRPVLISANLLLPECMYVNTNIVQTTIPERRQDPPPTVGL